MALAEWNLLNVNINFQETDKTVEPKFVNFKSYFGQ